MKTRIKKYNHQLSLFHIFVLLIEACLDTIWILPICLDELITPKSTKK